jgi:hypothetical protein
MRTGRPFNKEINLRSTIWDGVKPARGSVTKVSSGGSSGPTNFSTGKGKEVLCCGEARGLRPIIEVLLAEKISPQDGQISFHQVEILRHDCAVCLLLYEKMRQWFAFFASIGT